MFLESDKFWHTTVLAGYGTSTFGGDCAQTSMQSPLVAVRRPMRLGEERVRAAGDVGEHAARAHGLQQREHRVAHGRAQRRVPHVRPPTQRRSAVRSCTVTYWEEYLRTPHLLVPAGCVLDVLPLHPLSEVASHRCLQRAVHSGVDRPPEVGHFQWLVDVRAAPAVFRKRRNWRGHARARDGCSTNWCSVLYPRTQQRTCCCTEVPPSRIAAMSPSDNKQRRRSFTVGDRAAWANEARTSTIYATAKKFGVTSGMVIRAKRQFAAGAFDCVDDGRY